MFFEAFGCAAKRVALHLQLLFGRERACVVLAKICGSMKQDITGQSMASSSRLF